MPSIGDDMKTVATEMSFSDESFSESDAMTMTEPKRTVIVWKDVGGGGGEERWSLKENNV